MASKLFILLFLCIVTNILSLACGCCCCDCCCCDCCCCCCDNNAAACPAGLLTAGAGLGLTGLGGVGGLGLAGTGGFGLPGISPGFLPDGSSLRIFGRKRRRARGIIGKLDDKTYARKIRRQTNQRKCDPGCKCETQESNFKDNAIRNIMKKSASIETQLQSVLGLIIEQKEPVMLEDGRVELMRTIISTNHTTKQTIELPPGFESLELNFDNETEVTTPTSRIPELIYLVAPPILTTTIPSSTSQTT